MKVIQCLRNKKSSIGKYEDAVSYIEKGAANNPKFLYHHCILAASYAFLGQISEAQNALQSYLKALPKNYYPSIQKLYFDWPFKNVEVFDRLAEGLVKAGLPGDPSDYYQVIEENKLTGDEIEKTLYGHTIAGAMPWGEWWEAYDTDGNVFLKVIGSNQAWEFNDKGKTWIERDMRCGQYEKSNEGLTNCAEYYRNPDGNAESKSEYLSLDYTALHPFSVEN